MTAADAPTTASRKTSRGCTRIVSNVPIEMKQWPLNPPAGVQKQDHKAFTVSVEIRVFPHVLVPVCRGLVWRVAELHLCWSRALAQVNDLKLFWVKSFSKLVVLSI
jgi:hypothetical protein